MDYEANRPVEASARTFAIVERLSTVEISGVSAIAGDLDMSKGIVHNHLSTLRELGYVTKVDDGYQLSPKLLAVGISARSNTPLYQFGSDIVAPFAEQFDVSVVVCQRSGGSCTVLDAYKIPPALDLGVGTELPIRESLVGLVQAVEDSVVDPDNTAEYDVESVTEDLEADGYAVGRLATDRSTECIAVPILDEEGACRGSVGVLLPERYGDQRLQRLCEATGSLRTRIEDRYEAGWTAERSFATEKHSWIG